MTLPGLSYSAKQLLLEMRTLRYDIQLQIYGDIQMADERYNDLAQLARNEVGGNETGTVVTKEKYNKYFSSISRFLSAIFFSSLFFCMHIWHHNDRKVTGPDLKKILFPKKGQLSYLEKIDVFYLAFL